MNNVDTDKPYKDFTARLKLLIQKHPELITTTLSNIFTMRLIGNKTHGDLAEIAVVEFINQYMYDFRSTHVGKDLYRAKSQEEDIKVVNEITNSEFSISLKAYGDGHLQLSTDKNFRMFPRLEQEDGRITDRATIQRVLHDPAFAEFQNINVLPLVYDEKNRGVTFLFSTMNGPSMTQCAFQKMKVAEAESIHGTDFLVPLTHTSARYDTVMPPPMPCNEDCGHIQKMGQPILTA
ncbi:MAG: hypothetical protein OXU40_03230 [Nitrospira sp.]|nr:hypothetical protein [Nitrospira sp.]